MREERAAVKAPSQHNTTQHATLTLSLASKSEAKTDSIGDLFLQLEGRNDEH
jgi:hypothetical protein